MRSYRRRLDLLGILVPYAAAALCMGLGRPAEAQTIIRGRVVEDVTEQPIATVDLRLIALDGEILEAGLTDETGGFRINVPEPGIYSLSVRRVGYAPIVADSLSLQADEQLDLLIKLDPSAVVLEAVTVVATSRIESGRLARFRERAELNQLMGRGRIYMRDDIERMGGNTARDLLEGLTGVSSCRYVVMLDGLASSELLQGVTPDMLEGIEIYRGVTQIPSEYYRYGMCGLTMLWTRDNMPGGKPLSWPRVAVAAALLTLFGLLVR